MSNSYRNVILAFAGLILAANAQPIGNGAGSNSTAAQRDQNTAENANIAVGISRMGSALEAQNTKTDPYEKERNEREIRDLQAQENSAYWAGAMFYATCVAVILSIVGIFLIYITFRAQRNGNDIAKDTAALQLRPYVMLTDDKLGDGKLEVGEIFYFAIRNFGQTPARNLQLRRSWNIVNRPIGDIYLELTESEPETYGLIGPNQKLRGSFTIDMNASQIAEIASGKAFMLRVKISYEWGICESDIHDCTYVLASNGDNLWELGLITNEERKSEG